MPKRPVFELHCPANPDVICPAKAAIVKTYTGDANGSTRPESEEVNGLTTLALRERDMQGSRRNCAGLNEQEDCSVRDEVNASPVRRAMIDTARKLMGRVIAGPTN